ncbi:MAG: hypothetical protein B7X75_06415 [Sphingobacteriales bacterium 39-40-5]|nr:MAG: hypothetical protein B7X75_06415 [Sphingobacteriales bacterium 39-40-5]
MSNLLTQNSNALRLLMTEDLYILPENEQLIPAKAEQALEISSQEINDVQFPEIPAPQTEAVLPQKPAEPEKIREFNYLGENNKYFLIIFNEPNQKDISSTQKETLLKIMSAKGLELRDLAVLNLNQYPRVNYTDLKEFFSFNKIVLFGIDPQQISLSPQSSNQVVKLENAKILCTYGIDEMIKDTTKKREFWNVMKDF